MDENEELLDVLTQLSILEPVGLDAAPAAHLAFERVTKAAAQPLFAPPSRRYRTLSVFAMLVVISCAIVLFPPTRALASEFLSLFRVEKFAPISVSPLQLEILAELGESGLFPAEITPIGPSVAPVKFDSVAEAETYMLQVEKPAFVTTFHDLGEPDFLSIESSNDALIEINLEGARDVLEAVGGDPSALPDTLVGRQIDVQTHEMLTQQWFDSDVLLAQTLNPEVAYPDGVNPAELGAAILQFLGMNASEATWVARSIDWTTTMVLPVPTDLGTFSEVQIGETTGLAIEPLGVGATLIWQQNDKMYVLTGYGEHTTVTYLLDLIENGQFR